MLGKSRATMCGIPCAERLTVTRYLASALPVTATKATTSAAAALLMLGAYAAKLTSGVRSDRVWRHSEARRNGVQAARQDRTSSARQRDRGGSGEHRDRGCGDP